MYVLNNFVIHYYIRKISNVKLQVLLFQNSHYCIAKQICANCWENRLSPLPLYHFLPNITLFLVGATMDKLGLFAGEMAEIPWTELGRDCTEATPTTSCAGGTDRVMTGTGDPLWG